MFQQLESQIISKLTKLAITHFATKLAMCHLKLEQLEVRMSSRKKKIRHNSTYKKKNENFEILHRFVYLCLATPVAVLYFNGNLFPLKIFGWQTENLQKFFPFPIRGWARRHILIKLLFLFMSLSLVSLAVRSLNKLHLQFPGKIRFIYIIFYCNELFYFNLCGAL